MMISKNIRMADGPAKRDKRVKAVSTWPQAGTQYTLLSDGSIWRWVRGKKLWVCALPPIHDNKEYK